MNLELPTHHSLMDFFLILEIAFWCDVAFVLYILFIAAGEWLRRPRQNRPRYTRPRLLRLRTAHFEPETDMGSLRVECAWCGLWLSGPRKPFPGQMISHGMCPSCAAVEQARLDRLLEV